MLANVPETNQNQVRKAPPAGIRMLATDLDDTLLDSQKVFRAEVATALRHAVEAGLEVVPATGRQLNSIPKEILGTPGIRYCITSNGARIYDLADNTILLEDCFSEVTALELLEEAEKYDVLMAVYMDGVGYAQRRDLDFLKGVLPEPVLEYFRNARIPTDDLLGFVRQHGGKVEKISLHFTNQTEREEALRTLSRRADTEVTASSRTNLELNTKTANKGAAMMFLVERLGIGAEQIAAMGDSANDRTMLQTAGWAIVMDNATPEIKALADMIAPDCEEGGAAVAIEELLEKLENG